MAIVLGSTSAGTLGTLTLSDLKAQIQAEGYANDTSTQQTIMIRSVLRRLYGQRRWKFAAATSLAFTATVANAGAVALGTLGRGIMLNSVRIESGTDYRTLDFVDYTELAKRRHLDRGVGVPRYWSRQGDTVYFYPRPDATYALAIDYQALITLPSADGDSIVWPETHADVIAYAVIMRLARRQRDWNGFDRAKVDYTEALLELMRDEEFTDMETDLEVQPGGGLGWQDVV